MWLSLPDGRRRHIQRPPRLHLNRPFPRDEGAIRARSGPPTRRARAYHNEAPVGRAVRDSGVVSAPQLCIRYLLQKGAVMLPKATKTPHIEQNTQLDFEISAADMGTLDAMRNTETPEDATEFRWS